MRLFLPFTRCYSLFLHDWPLLVLAHPPDEVILLHVRLLCNYYYYLVPLLAH